MVARSWGKADRQGSVGGAQGPAAQGGDLYGTVTVHTCSVLVKPTQYCTYGSSIVTDAPHENNTLVTEGKGSGREHTETFYTFYYSFFCKPKTVQKNKEY